MERGDIAVIPSWTSYSLEAVHEDATILTVSDAPIFSRLGFRDPADLA